jgi:hypothetical protein
MARSRAGALLLLSLPTSAFAQDDDGTLRVSSTVTGATVYIDNELQGETPYNTTLEPGRHTVRVTANGYDPFVREVQIAPDQATELTASLSPGAGTVELLSTARGAVVTLDNDQQWALPVRLSPNELPFGSYEYTISAPTYAPLSGSISFAAGENVLVFGQLESNTGHLSIISTPAGADVYISETAVGVTPLDLSGYAPDVYTVRLEHPRHALVFRTLDTTDGELGTLEARIPKQGGRLIVRTGDPDAEVRLEGQLIGTGTKVTVPVLERRQYLLEAAAPGSKTAEVRVDIPMRGRVLYSVSFENESSRRASTLNNVPPLLRRWTFWTATGAGAVVATVGGVLLYNALQPDPVPDGDVVVYIP